MKQLIAVDFESLIGNNNFFSEDGGFAEFKSMIKRYHLIAIDDNKCLSDLIEIKQFLFDTNNSLKTLFNDYFIRLFGLSDLYKTITPTENVESNIYFSLAKSTPDKVLVSTNESVKKTTSINSYNIQSFIDTTSKPKCVLFRIPKVYAFVPRYKFANFNFLRPFIYNSKTIEFMDNYLFSNESLDGFQFILEILKLTENIENIIFHIKEPFKSSGTQIYAKKEIKNLFSKVKVRFKKYCKYEGYHDRFIVTNFDEFSINFTHSFNNIKCIDSKFTSKDAFQISITQGRNYIVNESSD